MRVVVAGSSGLIGTALVAHLRSAGHEVLRLVRRAPAAPDERGWDPAAGTVDPGTFDGVDAVVNLNGAGVADRPWSGARRQALRDSRIVPTEVLARAVAEHHVPTLLSGSAVGYYGDKGGVTVDESAPPGTGFLAGLTRDWEAAAQPARDAGARVVTLRTGLVLAPSGGLLGPLRLVYKFALGGRIGLGHPVHAVDLAGRRGRRDGLPAGARRGRRPGEPHRARCPSPTRSSRRRSRRRSTGPRRSPCRRS